MAGLERRSDRQAARRGRLTIRSARPARSPALIHHQPGYDRGPRYGNTTGAGIRTQAGWPPYPPRSQARSFFPQFLPSLGQGLKKLIQRRRTSCGPGSAASNSEPIFKVRNSSRVIWAPSNSAAATSTFVPGAAGHRILVPPSPDSSGIGGPVWISPDTVLAGGVTGATLVGLSASANSVWACCQGISSAGAIFCPESQSAISLFSWLPWPRSSGVSNSR